MTLLSRYQPFMKSECRSYVSSTSCYNRGRKMTRKRERGKEINKQKTRRVRVKEREGSTSELSGIFFQPANG